jgi:hypothetical protein
MLTAGRLLDLLKAHPEGQISWGSLDGRLDAEIPTLPTGRELLVQVLRTRPAHDVLVLWRVGDQPVYVRSWLTPRSGGVVLYLDVADGEATPDGAGCRFYIYPVAAGRVRIAPALPSGVPWYGVIDIGAAATAPDGPLTPVECVAWLDGLHRRGIAVELRPGPS